MTCEIAALDSLKEVVLIYFFFKFFLLFRGFQTAHGCFPSTLQREMQRK